MPRRENSYQPSVIRKIERMLPGILIRKHNMQQGWPDLMLLYGPHYGFLEVKRKFPTHESDWEPNQEWWIAFFAQHAFSAMICPENEKEVLLALQRAFTVQR